MSPRWLFIFSALVISFFLILPKATAQFASGKEQQFPGEPIRLKADHISYDHNTDVYIAEGQVEIWQGDTKLTAHRVVLSGRSHEVEAQGNVILWQGDDVLRSERMIINLETNLGIIIKGALFLKKQNFYLRGEEIERVGEDTYRIREGSFTTCDGDWPAWRFQAKETLVTLEEYASVWGATFQIKNVPVLYSPYLFFPVKTERQSGFLIPRITYSDISGWELSNAYFWAITKNMDATFYLDLASVRGVGEGLEFRYQRRQESGGRFYGYHIREEEAYRQKRSEQLDRTADRWYAEFQHEEYFDPSFYIKAKLRHFSDRQYLRDYGITAEDRFSEQAYSQILLTKNWESFALFGEVRHTVDLTKEDKTTLQRYPWLEFKGMRQQIGKSPFYYSIDSAYGYFWREEGVTGHLLDLFPRLALPLRLGPVEFTPDVGYRQTLYLSRNGGEETFGRGLPVLQATAATELYRVFDSPWASLAKIKHILRPEINYTYLPEVSQEKVPNYDLPLLKVSRLSYGLAQRLIGKITTEKSGPKFHELLYLRLSQSYDFHEASREVTPETPPRKPFGALNGQIKISPLKYFSLENNSTYDPHEQRFLTSFTNARFYDARGDQLLLEYAWAEGSQNQLNGHLQIKLTPSLDFGYEIRHSFLDQQTIETIYRLHYRHQCWSVDISYSEKPALAGQPAERKAMVMLNLVGVTSVGKGN